MTDRDLERPRWVVGLTVRVWVIAVDVLLASLGFAVFIWGDLTTHRGLRAGGVALVTLAFVAGAVISSLYHRAR
jgi:hypothetical protein